MSNYEGKWNDQVGVFLIYDLTILMERLGVYNINTEKFLSLINSWNIKFIDPEDNK